MLNIKKLTPLKEKVNHLYDFDGGNGDIADAEPFYQDIEEEKLALLKKSCSFNKQVKN